MKFTAILSVSLLLTVVGVLPSFSETVYMIIKSYSYEGLAGYTIPMKSLEQCEEAGASVIGSERFILAPSDKVGFECIVGK
tara:strand:+ start:65 stop:307 length:243 start_codon:yes stop_codon:yes gene_type:complete